MTVILHQDVMRDVFKCSTQGDSIPPIESFGFTFTALPIDVLLLIVARYLSTADAISLAQTSRRMTAIVSAAVRRVHLTQPYKAGIDNMETPTCSTENNG